MKLRFIALCTLAAIGLSGCHSVDIKDNIVRGPVFIPFATEGDWQLYGVGGPLMSRAFIRWKELPRNYPYDQYSFTGMGGVLLVCKVDNALAAYDMSCPVERSQSVTVAVNPESNYAQCPKCKSVYDVFGLDGPGGYPVSGRAREEGYALTPYRVVFGADNRYALITP